VGTTSAEETKALVLKAFDTLFNKRDYAKAAEFWSDNYIQHSATARARRTVQPHSQPAGHAPL
jgi:predicted SnoaL-like aldol condensation-catalyzing enzyme